MRTTPRWAVTLLAGTALAGCGQFSARGNSAAEIDLAAASNTEGEATNFFDGDGNWTSMNSYGYYGSNAADASPPDLDDEVPPPPPPPHGTPPHGTPPQ